MPRLRSIGLAPAVMSFVPSAKMACARTVAVVVPSPATSEVLAATSFTICAPMFSNRFSSSISLATVTPSLVMVGAPQDFSRTTLRPRGPSVTFTALASVLSPLPIRLRALVLKRISFAAMASSSFLENRKDVVLAKNDVVLTIELYFGARVLADEHLVAGLDRVRLRLAALEDPAGAHGD